MKSRMIGMMLILSLTAVWSLQRDVHSDEPTISPLQPVPDTAEEPSSALPPPEPLADPASPEGFDRPVSDPDPAPTPFPTYPPGSEPQPDPSVVRPVYPPTPDSLLNRNRRLQEQPSHRDPEPLQSEPGLDPDSPEGKLQALRQRWTRLSQQYGEKLTADELNAKIEEMEKQLQEAEAAFELRLLQSRLEQISQKYGDTAAGTKAKAMLRILADPASRGEPSPFGDGDARIPASEATFGGLPLPNGPLGSETVR